STMQGEEEAVLAAARELAGQALLVLAPRHPERFDAVAEHLTATGLSWQRRASWPVEGEEPAAESALDVVLLDSLGELAGLYALAAGAFIGGTLVPTGGHNPLEAMRHGVPVVAGPSMENFRAMAEDLDAAGAWARVADAAGLAAAWRGW